MTQEYETLMFPSSTDQKEIRDTLNIYGQGRWKLVNSYVTQRIGDKNGTMFIFMREVSSTVSSFDPYFPAKVLFGVSFACFALYGFLSFIMRH